MQLPELWSDEYSIDGNTARQLLVKSSDDVQIALKRGKLIAVVKGQSWPLLNPDEEYTGSALCLRLATTATSPEDVDLIGAQWIGHRVAKSPSWVLNRLKNTFSFLQEDQAAGIKGLRIPQVGAIHSVLGQWTLKSLKPATVVLPTGTGKTETMLSLFVAARPRKLLVIVPSDALRSQLIKKFENYGVLKPFGVVSDSAPFPVVGRIEHGFTTKLGARGFAAACNIVITTPSALNSSTDEVREALLKTCSHLFVDEAHHITATTWKQIRDEFIGKPVIQFTATPYRTDGADLGGRLIYNFPLKLAQEQGYFSKINYIPVVDYDDPDRALAIKAIERLRADLSANYSHLLMARVRTIKRAQALLDMYQELAPDLNPVAIYHQVPARERKASMLALETRESRIVVCVDMLGEGFDMPSLKVAAIHDPHKSLGITLQFIGRFARVSDHTIGEASVVVNRGDPQHDRRLKDLYAEDSDWNFIIQELAANAAGEQEEVDEFEDAFNSLPDEISLRNISPKMSTVVYKTHCTNWNPETLADAFKEKLYTKPVPINHQEHVAWLVTKEVVPVRWGDLRSFDEVVYNLYIFYWDSTNQLLYINSSGNDGVFQDLAKGVCGDSVERFKGDDVFKPLAAIKRRVATNVGLLDTRNRDSSFEMQMGANVEFTSSARRNKTQTNIFAHGYDEKTAERVTVGVSRKGRVWSHKAALNMKSWMKWCDHVGTKLTDVSISADAVTAGFMVPEPLVSRPALIPLVLEWPSETYMNISDEVLVEFGRVSHPLIDSELVITDFKESGPIPFVIRTPEWESKYEIVLSDGEMKFRSIGAGVHVLTRRMNMTFSDYLSKTGLRIVCEGQAVITPDMELYRPNAAIPAFDVTKLETISWDGINIRSESQGQQRDPTTVQARTIEHIRAQEEWDVIIDDDGSGEAADIVAMKIEGDSLIVSLTHCKFSSESSPGFRIEDLYEVCGQAIKSTDKVRRPDLMVANLVRREKNRRQAGRRGIVVGNDNSLQQILERTPYLRPNFTITIVQPGVSKRQVSAGQLELLSATEGYISDTGGGTPLKVIIND